MERSVKSLSESLGRAVDAELQMMTYAHALEKRVQAMQEQLREAEKRNAALQEELDESKKKEKYIIVRFVPTESAAPEPAALEACCA